MYSTRYSCQILRNLNFLEGFSKNTQISNLMKLLPVAAELFHSDGQDRTGQDRTDKQTERRTDRHDEANSRPSKFSERA